VKSRRSRLPRPPINAITVLFSIAAVFFVLGFGGKALEGYRVRRHNETLRAELAALEAVQQQLRARLEYVQTSAYVEKVAREQYRWTKEGETLVIPIFRQTTAEPANPRPSPQPAASIPANRPTGRWPEWWSLLTASFD